MRRDPGSDVCIGIRTSAVVRHISPCILPNLESHNIIMALMYKDVRCLYVKRPYFRNYLDHKTEYVQILRLNKAAAERNTLGM